MPKFAVISPSHISGKKKESWEGFRDGGYVALGSTICVDMSSKTEEEVELVVMSIPRDSQAEITRRTKDYTSFLALKPGDYIAVNNTNDGLFGIGKVTSDYYFKPHAHNPGSSDPQDHYCHFRNIQWLVTDYLKRKDILAPGEKGWPPYGIISLASTIPPYIQRILSKHGITAE